MKPTLVTLLLVLTFCSSNSLAQQLSATRKTLNTLFRKSVPEHAHYSSGASMHQWLICGTDSSISLLDTVRIQNYDYPEKNCWNHTTWEFYKRHSFKKYADGYDGCFSSRDMNYTDFRFHSKLKKRTINYT